MPSRWQCLLIVAFWLAASSWLYVRELQDLFREHDPPPYVIELTAETQFIHPRVVWKVFQNDQPEESYFVRTWMEHTEEDDSFTLFAHVMPASLQTAEVKEALLIQDLTSSYRVSREGRLREFSVEGDLSRRPMGFADLGFKPQFKMKGVVVDGPMMVARLELPQFASVTKLPQFNNLARIAESNFIFPVSHNGAIFLPLHPVHKILGVRPGKTWRLPEIDPLADAARAWLRKFAVDLPVRSERFLDARVRDQAEPFPYDMGDEESHVCWVIDYRDLADDGKLVATTRVEVGTNLVLSQEASNEGTSLRVVRDSARSKVR
jgi:hypothetical protein